MRNFNEWLSNFKVSIASYKYYVDFEKVFRNVESIKIELNILNVLIGSDHIEDDFDMIVERYPEVLKCIPILLAKRETEIIAQDISGMFVYDFKNPNQTKEQYKYFMRETGLFELIEKHIINNLYDYVSGVEVGLDSNGRKNRGGDLMEDLVESYLINAGKEYYKEMYISDITRKWGVDMSAISNRGKTEKRFDFVIKTDNMIYGIETNFYTGGGSKLNETSRSYKELAIEAKQINGFKFVWITDGIGWNSARHNLEETFEVLDTIYSITDLENGVIERELI